MTDDTPDPPLGPKDEYDRVGDHMSMEDYMAQHSLLPLTVLTRSARNGEESLVIEEALIADAISVPGDYVDGMPRELHLVRRFASDGGEFHKTYVQQPLSANRYRMLCDQLEELVEQYLTSGSSGWLSISFKQWRKQRKVGETPEDHVESECLIKKKPPEHPEPCSVHITGEVEATFHDTDLYKRYRKGLEQLSSKIEDIAQEEKRCCGNCAWRGMVVGRKVMCEWDPVSVPKDLDQRCHHHSFTTGWNPPDEGNGRKEQ